MGYQDELPPEEQETGKALHDRLEAFARKVHELTQLEPQQSGCGGVLLGYGLGLVMAQGATEADLRAHCDKIIRGLIKGQAAIEAHERKTFS